MCDADKARNDLLAALKKCESKMGKGANYIYVSASERAIMIRKEIGPCLIEGWVRTACRPSAIDTLIRNRNRDVGDLGSVTVITDNGVDTARSRKQFITSDETQIWRADGPKHCMHRITSEITSMRVLAGLEPFVPDSFIAIPSGTPTTIVHCLAQCGTPPYDRCEHTRLHSSRLNPILRSGADVDDLVADASRIASALFTAPGDVFFYPSDAGWLAAQGDSCVLVRLRQHVDALTSVAPVRHVCFNVCRISTRSASKH